MQRFTSETLLNHLINVFSDELTTKLLNKDVRKKQKKKKKIRTNALTQIKYGEYFIHDSDEKTEYKLIKIVAISDTHQKHKKLNLPKGDILILSGDYTKKGTINEALKVNQWLGIIKTKCQYKHILLINGNHEGKGDILLTNQYTNILAKHKKTIQSENTIKILHNIYKQKVNELKEIMNNCIILDDESIIIEGIKFYGTSWCSSRKGKNDPLYLQPKFIFNKWNNIPKDVNYLITHDAPQGIMNRLDHPGCPQLRLRLNELKELRVHQFGHIHGCWGYQFITKQSMMESVKDDEKFGLYLSDRYGDKLMKYKQNDINNKYDVDKCVLFLNAVNNGVEQPMWLNFYVKK
eukprot:39390_1